MTSFLIREALICSVGLVFSNFLTSCSGSWSGDIVNKSIYSVCFKHQPYPESPGPVYSLFCLLSKTHSCKRKRESALDQSRKEGRKEKAKRMRAGRRNPERWGKSRRTVIFIYADASLWDRIHYPLTHSKAHFKRFLLKCSRTQKKASFDS